MNSKLLIPTVAMTLALATTAFAAEITGTLTAGAGTSSVGGTVTAPPTASPAPGTYSNFISVTLTSPGSSSIRYTINGSTPTCAGGGLLYTSPVAVIQTLTMQAVSCYSSGASSNVGLSAYVINAGSLGGTVVAPATGGGSTGGTGGTGGGGGGGAGSYLNSSMTGAGTVTGGTPSGGGAVLGTTTATPNLPSTGEGGNVHENLLILTLAALAALGGAIGYRRYRASV
ncbi:MAG: chitobiase/beta-hexosaminidase C-terminal domain-containing protein [bacterium]|nr:chitobiase/beta-hexosaminidase C-terminal domain-containing protein [bacterium]